MLDTKRKDYNSKFIIFIMIQPILDIITSISINTFHINLTIGIIARMIFLLFTMYETIFVYHKNKNIIYYVLCAVYFLLYIGGIIFYRNGNNLIGEIQGLLRTFYFPLMLISLYSIKDELKIDDKVLTGTILTYIFLIFISMLLGIGYNSYDITKDGTAGFFNSANEIGGIIAIITPVAIMSMLKNNKMKALNVAIALIYIIVILNIGTKTPIIAFFLVILLSAIWLIAKYILEKKRKAILMSAIIVIIVGTMMIIIMPRTNFYKNIRTHMEFLGIDSVVDVVDKPLLMDHFIFSQRLTFLDNKRMIYDASSTYEKIVGTGYFYNDKQTKLIEIDYFDIYYSHGILGFVLFFSIYIYIVIGTIRKLKKVNYDIFLKIIGLFLILILSLFTGHIITSPAVSIFAICIIIMLNAKDNYKKEYKKRKNGGING